MTHFTTPPGMITIIWETPDGYARPVVIPQNVAAIEALLGDETTALRLEDCTVYTTGRTAHMVATGPTDPDGAPTGLTADQITAMTDRNQA